MKKAVGITVGVVAVVAAGWLGGTWYTGKRIQDESPARLAEVNQRLADAFVGMGFGVEIQQLAYERGFFASQARYGVSLIKTPDSPDDLPEGTAEFTAQVEHGPFPKGAVMRGKLLPKLAFVHAELAATEDVKSLFDLTQGATPFSSDTVVSYNGDSTGTADVAPFKLQKEGKAVDFSGAHAEGQYTQSTRNSTARVVVGHINLDATQTDAVKLAARNITMDVDTRQGQFGFGIGSSSAKVEQLDIESLDAGTKVNLKGLGYTAHLGESGANLNLETGYSVEQLNVNGMDFGKGSAMLKLDRVDGQAIAGLTKLHNEVLTEMSQGKTSDEALTDERRQVLAQYGKQVLAGNPSLRLDPVAWQTPKGESRLTLALDLTAPPGLDADTATADQASALVQQAIKLLDIKVSLSKPMVQGMSSQLMQAQGLSAEQSAAQAGEQVATLAGLAEMLGLGKSEGDNLVSSLHYADGAATLNGQPVPIDQLFGDLFGAMGTDEQGMAPMGSEPADPLTPARVGEALGTLGLDFSSPAPGGGTVFNVQLPEGSGAGSMQLDLPGCEGRAACPQLLFSTNIATRQPVPADVLQAWNDQSDWTYASAADGNGVTLEMDVDYTQDSADDLEEMIAAFIQETSDFADAVNNPAQ
ncbi:DUF945 family protein [Bordetella petrii]|uniref:DUF945 family protein n=1 Tax=Bordetella petrii TaxID=94624 RepID=UPI001E3D75BA|nr:DUF945 family protein [Bordetella petrii]MCD0503711.1 DUF945 family protein [Bordetella petrii]